MNRMLAYTLLSYGFVTVYGVLYGPEPVLLHRLGVTTAVLCFLVASIGLFGWLTTTVAVFAQRRTYGKSIL